MTRDELKKLAAEAAVAEVEEGMMVGLGTGSTAEFAIRALAARVNAGLRVTGIATSVRSAQLASSLGIAVGDPQTMTSIDLTIDGADEVDQRTLSLIKGLGGALLREKIVAAASRQMVVVVDSEKVVDRLGRSAPVPVEIVDFGVAATMARLRDIAGEPSLRMTGGTPFRTDGGNLIADCATGPLSDPSSLERELSRVVGVVESGLFIGLATRVIVGTADGIQALDAPAA